MPQKLSLPPMHISIETGKVTPRFDTLLDLVKVPGYDLLLVLRERVPMVQALSREGDDERLYVPDEAEKSLN